MTASVSFAWITGYVNNIDHKVSQGSVVKQYFHCGTGTKDDPFVITRPIHYYHLVELYQRLSGFAAENYYFQLGYDLDGDGDKEVYAYDSEGQLITDSSKNPTYSDSLNMAYYSGNFALLPIGTSDVPFDGHFDGSGLAVNNLSIKGDEYVGEHHYGTCDVGIFGYVGPAGEIRNTYFDNVNITVQGSSTDFECKSGAVSDHDTDSDGTEDIVYVGSLIGHLYSFTNATINYDDPMSVSKAAQNISDVYVNNVSITGGNSTITKNNFGYIGYIDLLDGTKAISIADMINNDELHYGKGDEGWGGSIGMNDLFRRLKNVAANANNPMRVTTEKILVDKTGDSDVTTVLEQAKTQNNLTIGWLSSDNREQTGTLKYYFDTNAPENGSYSIIDRGQTSDFNYLYGVNPSDPSYRRNNRTYANNYTKSVTTITKTLLTDRGIVFSDTRGNFLAANASGVSNVTNISNATAFAQDSDGHLFFADDTKYENYYLNYNRATKSLEITNTGTTVWIIDNTENICYWAEQISVMALADFDDTEDPEAPETPESPEDADPSEEPEEPEDVMPFAEVDAELRWYLCFKGEKWACNPASESFYIYGEENGERSYLSADTENVISVSNASDAPEWMFDSENGWLYVIVEGDEEDTLVYLNASTGALTVGEFNGIPWSFSGGAESGEFSFSVGSAEYALVLMDKTWIAVPKNESFIKIYSDADHYLGIEGSAGNYNAVNANSENAAAAWGIENAGEGEAVHLYTYLNGSKHYLCGEASLSIRNDNPTAWTWNEELGTYTTEYAEDEENPEITTTMYLVAPTWELLPFSESYQIYSGSSYLSTNGTDAVLSDSVETRRWLFDEYVTTSAGIEPDTEITTTTYAIKCYIDGEYYYLNGSDKLYVSTEDDTRWTISESKYTYTYDDKLYSLEFVDASWTVVDHANTRFFTIKQDNGHRFSIDNGLVKNPADTNETVFGFEMNPGSDTQGYVFYMNEGKKYYLNGDGSAEGGIVVSETAESVWTIENGIYSYNQNDTDYYLTYVGGRWNIVSGEDTFLKIYIDASHYLGLEGTRLIRRNNAAAASTWGIDVDGYIYTFIDGEKHFLNGEGSLKIGEMPISRWTVDKESNHIFCEYEDLTWYLRYDTQTSWHISPVVEYLSIWGEENGNMYPLGITSVEIPGEGEEESTWETQATTDFANDWVYLPERKQLYTVIADDAYYLCAGAGPDLPLTIVKDAASATIWNAVMGTETDEEGNEISVYKSFTTEINGATCSLRIVNGKWSLETPHYIRFNEHYLALDETDFTDASTQDDAEPWYFDSENHIYCYIGADKYYIVGNASEGTMSLSDDVSIATVWACDDSWYFDADGVAYNIAYGDGGWRVIPSQVSYAIYMGSDKNNCTTLNFNGIEFSAGHDITSATHWFAGDDPNTSAKFRIYTVIDGTNYYICGNTGLYATTVADEATLWSEGDGSYGYTLDETRYNLSCVQGVWKVTSRFTFYDNFGHYLEASGDPVSLVVGNSDTANDWVYDAVSHDVYATINGQVYYLVPGESDGITLKLAVGTSRELDWTYDSENRELTCIYNGHKHGVKLVKDSWALCDMEKEYFVIQSGENYLGVMYGEEDDKVHVQYMQSIFGAALWTDTDGIFSTVINGDVWYLNGDYNHIFAQKTTPSDITFMITDGRYLDYEISSGNYKGEYRLGTEADDFAFNKKLTYYYLHNGKNYLAANGSSIKNESEENASRWVFDGKKIYTINKDGKRYINMKFELSWGILGGQLAAVSLSDSGTDLTFDFGSNNQSTIYVTIARMKSYLALSGDSWKSDDSSYTITRTKIESQPRSISASSLRESPTYLNGFNKVKSQLQVALSYYVEEGDLKLEDIPQELDVTSTNIEQDIFVDDTIDFRTRLIETSNEINTLISSREVSNILPITKGEAADVKTVYRLPIRRVLSMSFGNVYEYTTEVVNSEPSTLDGPNYIPLIANQSSPFEVYDRNTGYITAMKTDNNIGANIRISQYNMSNIGVANGGNNSYNATRFEMITRTGSSGGYVRIDDTLNSANGNVSNQISGLQKKSYEELGLQTFLFEIDDNDPATVNEVAGARTGLHNMLNGQSNIYGLHFMNSEISKDNIVVAEKVKMNYRTYTDFPMPTNCIDFILTDKGTINFFAGTYFGGNNAFFSLHQIFRNADNSISDIKEIKYVYSYNDRKNYYYQFSDGSFFDGSLRGDAPVADGVLEFDTAWITNPDAFVTNAVYYFEIPALKGEYALGSVSGKTGAYLIYLDIETNGIQGRPFNQEYGISDHPLFTQIDYRDSDDTVIHSLLNLEYYIPSGSTADNFGIETSFDGNTTYSIYVTNKTGNTMDLYVLLCDNNDDPKDVYPYNYKLYLNGVEYTGGALYEDLEDGIMAYRGSQLFILSGN